MIEKTGADTAVAPLVGSLPPHCQRDVDLSDLCRPTVRETSIRCVDSSIRQSAKVRRPIRYLRLIFAMYC